MAVGWVLERRRVHWHKVRWLAGEGKPHVFHLAAVQSHCSGISQLCVQPTRVHRPGSANNTSQRARNNEKELHLRKAGKDGQ